MKNLVVESRSVAAEEDVEAVADGDAGELLGADVGGDKGDTDNLDAL